MAPTTTAPLRRDRIATAPSSTEDRRRHLRVVGRARRRFRLTPRTGVTLTVLLFVALFAVAVTHALLIESQIRLDRLDDEVAEEQARYERLRREVAELESPERVVADATAMGMVPPPEVVWVTPDTPANAADGEADDDSSDGSGGEAVSPDTSWADVKPYLESTVEATP
jgi:cell division protein FtsL